MAFKDFIHTAKNHPTLTKKWSFGQKAADFLTTHLGSWEFIIIFFAFILVWIFVNSYYLIKYELGEPFDPFPFILLNLTLSCIAALQAPIILMSQNRQTQKDRIRAEYDYAVNRKAEHEIQFLREQLARIEKKISKR